jgi:3-methylfumaryl-CoA hydratase
MDTAIFSEWIGRTERATDDLVTAPIAALNAMLDRREMVSYQGATLPELAHWLYFLPRHLQSELGEDGHAQRGGFLPPFPLPRRMWAGGRITFHAPLRIGKRVTRTSKISDIHVKPGRTGTLAFVLIRHEIVDADGAMLLTEEQDIVYREPVRPSDVGAAPPPPAQRAPQDAHWSREIEAHPALLFRYSALTFNSHRIHYDHPYTTHVEKYPGLVVHGPLQATLLMDLLRRHLPDANVQQFAFKAVRPTFAPHTFRVCGRVGEDGETVQLWAQDHEGWLTMTASATLASR